MLTEGCLRRLGFSSIEEFAEDYSRKQNNARQKAWRDKNKEAVNVKRQEENRANPEKERMRKAAEYAQDPEKERARKRREQGLTKKIMVPTLEAKASAPSHSRA